MSIADIILAIVILALLGGTIAYLIKNKKKSPCSGCSGCCDGCEHKK